MITELVFSREYASFWRNLTPTMDGFIRRLNSGLYEREFPSMMSKTLPNRRGFINQIAFEVYRLGISRQRNYTKPKDILDLVNSVGVEIAKKVESVAALHGSYILPLSEDEIHDVFEQNRRLNHMYNCSPGNLNVGPRFPGCGIMDSCVGDILKSQTLWEIKAGDRDFRAIDIRQLLIYSSLNSISRNYNIKALGLFNPRTGKSMELSLETLCMKVSGRDASDILSSIAYGLSSGGISR